MIIINKNKSNDNSIKYCFKTEDNKLIETVYIPGREKTKICVSTQIGCEFNCQHCATATIKYERKLKSYEIYEQVSICLDENEFDKKVEVMFYGMGEPITNLDEIVEAVKILKNKYEFIESDEQFFISTSGVPNGINKLIDNNLKYNLAVSLHSAIQEKRNSLIPHGKGYDLKALKRDILNYQKLLKKKIIIHYCLIKDFNDKKNDSETLYDFVKDINCQIDVIPFNEYEGCKYSRPEVEEAEEFVQRLKEKGIEIFLRPSKSRDINGACGQLALKNIKV